MPLNPYTGEEESSIATLNPYTGEPESATNPYTGEPESAVNPYTGETDAPNNDLNPPLAFPYGSFAPQLAQPQSTLEKESGQSLQRGAKQLEQIPASVGAVLNRALPGLEIDEALTQLSQLDRGEGPAEQRAQELADEIRSRYSNVASDLPFVMGLAEKSAQEAADAHRQATRENLEAIIRARADELAPFIAKTAKNQQEMQAIPQARILQQLSEHPTIGGQIGVLTSSPSALPEAALHYSLESFLPSAAGMVAGSAAGTAAGPAGTAAGAGLGAVLPELSGAIIEGMQRRGVDVTNEKSIKEFIQTPGFADVLNESFKKAVVIGGVEALSGGVAGRILSPQVGKGVVRVAGGALGELGVQSSLEAGGEIAGSLAGGQPIQAQDVIAEVLGSFPESGQEVVTNVASEVLANRHAAEVVENAAQQITQAAVEPTRVIAQAETVKREATIQQLDAIEQALEAPPATLMSETEQRSKDLTDSQREVDQTVKQAEVVQTVATEQLQQLDQVAQQLPAVAETIIDPLRLSSEVERDSHKVEVGSASLPAAPSLVTEPATQPVRVEGLGPRVIEAQNFLTQITKPDAVYRGMTAAEYDATIGSGEGVQSRRDFSFGREGTSFGEDAATAESYVNFGRDDPRVTGRPTYLVEVRKSDTLKRNRQGYYEAAGPIPQDDVTRVWRMDADGQEIVATEITQAPSLVNQPPTLPTNEIRQEEGQGQAPLLVDQPVAPLEGAPVEAISLAEGAPNAQEIRTTVEAPSQEIAPVQEAGRGVRLRDDAQSGVATETGEVAPSFAQPDAVETAVAPTPEPAVSPEGEAAGQPDKRAAYKWADQKIDESKGRLFTGLDPELFAAYTIKGVELLEQGIRNFAQWSAEMIRIIGERVKPHLRTIYDRSVSEFAGPIAGPDLPPATLEDANQSLAAANEDFAGEADALGINEDEKGRKISTQVLGHVYTVDGRQELTPERRQQAINHGLAVAKEAGFDVEYDPDTNLIVLKDESTPNEAAGKKFLDEILPRELARNPYDPSQPPINKVLDFGRGALHHADRVLSPSLRHDIFAKSHGRVSMYGLLLGAHSDARADLGWVARHVPTMLQYIWGSNFGGDAIGRILDHVRNTLGVGNPALSDEEALILAVANNPKYAIAAQVGRPDKPLPALEQIAKNFPLAGMRDELAQKGGEGIETLWWQLLSKSDPKQLSPIDSLDQAVQQQLGLMLREALDKLGLTKKGAPAPTDAEKVAQLLGEDQTRQERMRKADELIQRSLDEQQAAEETAALKDDEGDIDEALTRIQNKYAQLRSAWEEASAEMLTKPASSGTIRRMVYRELKEVIGATKGFWESQFSGARGVSETELRADVQQRVMARIDQVTQGAPKNPLAQQDLERLNRAVGAAFDQIYGVKRVARDAAILQRENQQKADDRALPEKTAKDIDESFMRLWSGTSEPKARSINLVRAAFARQARNPVKAEEFVAQLKALGVTEPTAERLEKISRRLWADRFAEKSRDALDRAIKRLQPKEAAEFDRALSKTKSLWQKLQELVNVGVFDKEEVLRQIAKANGWTVPTTKQIEQMRQWSTREKFLRTPNAADLAATEGNEYERAGLVSDVEAATLEERAKLKQQMQTLWTRLTKPLGYGDRNRRINSAQAGSEFVAANLLFKFGFATRQLIDVMTQAAVHTPSRAVSSALVRYQADTKAGRETRFWRDADAAIRDAYVARTRALGSAITMFTEALKGRREQRNVDKLMTGIRFFDRINQRADELMAEGTATSTAKGAMLRLTGFIGLSFRVASAFDNFHGTLVETQEMRQQVNIWMRDEAGMDSQMARENTDLIMGDPGLEWQISLARAQQIFEDKGVETSPGQLKAAAWDIVRSRQYSRMRSAKMPADDWREGNRILRDTVGWNMKEEGGIGGALATGLKAIAKPLQALGIPPVFSTFSNAIATGTNRMLTFTPLGLFETTAPLAGGGKDSKSAWWRTKEDRAQRKIESTVGTMVGGMLAYMAFAGLLRVRIRPPDDKEERDLMERQGHKWPSVEVALGDGKFLSMSLSTGPFSVVRPYLYGAGAIQDTVERHEKQVEKARIEAARKGVAFREPELNWPDLWATGLIGSWQALTGGRTSGGLLNSYTNFSADNATDMFVKPALSGYTSPLIPLLPAAQEIQRARGVRLNPSRATYIDLIFPRGDSPAARTNFLGDEIQPNDAQRIIQTFTGGTYPFPVDPKDAEDDTAYHVLIQSGWTPRTISPNEMFAINGELRALSAPEQKALELSRGRMLKAVLNKFNRDTVDQKYKELGEQKADELLGYILNAVGRVINTAALAQVANATSLNAEDYEAGQAAPPAVPQFSDENNPYLQ